MNTTNEIEKHYNKTAWIYDLRLFITEQLLLKKLRKNLLAKATGKTLEVAAGTGVNFQYYPQEIDISAVDISTSMIKVAYEKSKKLNLKVDIQKMNAAELNFPDDYFDTVVSTLAMCTFPDPEATIREMLRICKPSGKILLLEHGLSSYAWTRYFQKLREKSHFEKYQCHTTRDPLAILQQAEVHIASWKRHFFGIIYVVEVIKN